MIGFFEKLKYVKLFNYFVFRCPIKVRTDRKVRCVFYEWADKLDKDKYNSKYEKYGLKSLHIVYCFVLRIPIDI
jgi:hypothetical protein